MESFSSAKMLRGTYLIWVGSSVYMTGFGFLKKKKKNLDITVPDSIKETKRLILGDRSGR